MSIIKHTIKNAIFFSRTFAQPPKIQFISIGYFQTSSYLADWNAAHLCLPKSLYNSLRRKVHYPEKYTVKPLDNTHLAGRDPDTGRVVVSTLGGGIKHKYHWIDWFRKGPNKENEFLIEKVIQIMHCGCRTANIALVGSADRLRYILATVNMKAGDTIKTSGYIPRAPILPNEGDAFPLGALPINTLVNCVEKLPGSGGVFIHSAGACGTILRRVNDRVVVKMPSKLEISFDMRCMATVGQLSNLEHLNEQIGSPNKMRQMGRRPHSGLWHRKTGRFGRKIKPPPPVLIMKPEEEPPFVYRRLTMDDIKIRYPPNMGLVDVPTEKSEVERKNRKGYQSEFEE